MILFIIFIIASLFDGLIEIVSRGVGISKLSFHTVWKAFWRWFGNSVLLIAASAGLVFIISFCVYIGVSMCEPPRETSYWSFNINALQDNLVTEGEWYGRRGHVDGELSYFYSRTLPQGEKIGHIPADKTYVKYDNDARPHIEVHQSQLDIPEWLYKVFWLDWMNDKHTDYYVIVVPEGTISVSGEYEIDMG